MRRGVSLITVVLIALAVNLATAQGASTSSAAERKSNAESPSFASAIRTQASPLTISLEATTKGIG